MSLSISPSHVQTHAPIDPQAHWITPEEQLTRLALPLAEELVQENRHKFSFLPPTNPSDNCADPLEHSIIECVVRSILRHSDVSDKVPKLMDSIVEHFFKPSTTLPSHLTTWYKALKLIDKLPEKIPPLPDHITQILEGDCSRQICVEIKLDGTAYKIKEKCTLILVPQELKNPEEFEKVIKAYGEKHYPENENPLQCSFFWDKAREQHGKTPFGSTCWILHTNDVLAGSRNKTWDKQVDMVDALARETFIDWQIPVSFWETFLTITLTEIATGEKLYLEGNEQNVYRFTYARCQQTTEGYHLVVGGSAHFGVHVLDRDAYDSDDIGVAARRKF